MMILIVDSLTYMHYEAPLPVPAAAHEYSAVYTQSVVSNCLHSLHYARLNTMLDIVPKMFTSLLSSQNVGTINPPASTLQFGRAVILLCFDINQPREISV